MEEWLLVHGISKPIQFFFSLPACSGQLLLFFLISTYSGKLRLLLPPSYVLWSHKKRAQEKERATIITLGRLHFLRNREKHNTGKSACKDVITDKKRKGVFIYCCYFEILRLWGRIKDYTVIFVMNWSISLIWSIINPVEIQVIFNN